MQTTGSFEIKLTPQPADESNADPTRGRMSLDKQYRGGIEAHSLGEMLTGGNPAAGSAGYVAIERVTGTLDGKPGSFLLQHYATMHQGQFSQTIEVTPGSGTEELIGISGSMEIQIAEGKHNYVFDYTLGN